MMFSVQFNYCEAMPQPLQSESVEIRKVVHEGPNSAVMPTISFVSHDKPTIFGCLDDGIQFWLKSVDDFYRLVGSLVLGVPCIGKDMVEPNSDKNKQQSGNSQLSGDNGWFVQAVFLLVIVPLIAAFICIFYSHSSWKLLKDHRAVGSGQRTVRPVEVKMPVTLLLVCSVLAALAFAAV